MILNHPHSMSKDGNAEKFRIDKSICAARFFKTRFLAAESVECGHIFVNNKRVKPARTLALKDMQDISIVYKQYMVEVLGLFNIKGPASLAQNIYR